jgi:hypothetical protein
MDFPLLDAQECRSVVAQLDALEVYWTDRSARSDRSFCTLGRASYLDVCAVNADAETAYYAKLKDSNTLLQAQFQGLYDRLARALAGVLGADVVLATTLAIPGFHLFRGRGIAGAGAAGPHFDIQYAKLRLPPGSVSDDPISFTMALELPACGSGLDVWSVMEADFDRAFSAGRASTLDDIASRRTCAYHPYSCGAVFVQKGLWLHRLSTPGPVDAADRRITLQGHALAIDGAWLLYW